MHNLSIMLHKENLLNNQEHFKLIISFILTTPVSDLVGILVREIRCLSLLRVKLLAEFLWWEMQLVYGSALKFSEDSSFRLFYITL